MKSKNLYIIFLILFSITFILSSALSQEQEYHKSPLSIYGGVSIPMFEFGSSTGSDAGYAELGYSLNLDHSISIYEPIRLLTALTLSSNLIDKNTLRQKMIERIAPMNGIDQQYNQQFIQILGDNTSVNESGSYYSVFFLTGPEIQTQLLSDITVSGAIQAGVLYQYNPIYRVIYTGLRSNGEGFLYQPKVSKYAFAFGLSAGIEYNIFKLNVKYISGIPQYDITRTYKLPARITINTVDIDIPAASQYGSMNVKDQPTSMIVVLVGIIL